ncbi:NADPH-dependent FMN reductase [Massilia sp. TS11]|uniref:NADPH-dependent FMN reductase n=1 Tax=Massilia sp. TS11 TaxID=2908003 RepID=UPI001EDB9C2F|nr:NAD(P)H-dependent oxidoreductase [Massilia sp. TS11]MCG2583252.1 NAD(P)H-dependent oxidoreductase [Massilia sp. TS11]
MATKKVAVFVGSLRKDSFTRKVAKTLIALAPASLSLEIVEIGDLPLYDQDLDVSPPLAYTEFRNKVASVDAFLFCTPEYNRSVPAVLKNAIDVGSRPYGHSVWSGKPGAIVSVSPGALGGFGANHHLRQSMVFLNVPLMQQPEAYVNHIGNQFDGDHLTNEATREFLQKYILAFAAWVERNTD